MVTWIAVSRHIRDKNRHERIKQIAAITKKGVGGRPVAEVCQPGVPAPRFPRAGLDANIWGSEHETVVSRAEIKPSVDSAGALAADLC